MTEECPNLSLISYSVFYCDSVQCFKNLFISNRSAAPLADKVRRWGRKLYISEILTQLQISNRKDMGVLNILILQPNCPNMKLFAPNFPTGRNSRPTTSKTPPQLIQHHFRSRLRSATVFYYVGLVTV